MARQNIIKDCRVQCAGFNEVEYSGVILRPADPQGNRNQMFRCHDANPYAFHLRLHPLRQSLLFLLRSLEGALARTSTAGLLSTPFHYSLYPTRATRAARSPAPGIVRGAQATR